MSGKIRKILVVGAGVMGSSIAQVYAANGYETVMADVSDEQLQKAMARIEANIKGLQAEGLADETYEKTVYAHLSTMLNSRIPEAAGEFDLAAEVIYENPEAKRALFKLLSDNCREDCIFASDTSAMDVFSLTKDVVKRPERLVIAHWFNPPHLMKLIEIVKGPDTSDETVETVRALLEKCGKKPVVLNKFMPGFIVNRMGTVICRELLYMVDQGWVTPQDLDTALKYTDGLRWSFEGPLALVDFVGLEIPMAVAGAVLPSLCSDTQGIPYGNKLIAEGKTGVRAGEGILGKYPSDTEGYIARRNRRIVEMCKVIDGFDQEDERSPLK